MCAMIFLVALIAGMTSWVGPSLVVCFLSLALAAPSHPMLRHFTFTLWIATGAALGMSFPYWFIKWGDFELTELFVPLLQLIMFGMSLSLSLADFARVFKMPSRVLAGCVCHYTIMPVLGVSLAYLFGFPPEIGAGLILVGVSPSGLASNVMAHIAKGNVALSVTITAVSTLLAPLLTPLLMKLLAGQMIEIDVLKMMWHITEIVLLPVLAGLVFHHLLYHRMKWLERIMPVVSMAGIFAMTVLTVALGRDNLLKMGPLLIVACFLHCCGGFFLGYYFCRALGMDRLTCRTISFEVGLQNAGMASGIAKTLGKVATLGLAPIVFGPVMNITASTLSNWWRTHPVEKEAETPQ